MPNKFGASISRRRGNKTVDSVHGRVVAGHQVRDSAVDESLALQHVLAFKLRRYNIDCEVAAAAAHVHLCTGNRIRDCLLNRVRNGAFESREMNRHALL